jgi:antitoxin component YwqK of YwqJK toxin-antitoxin module
MKQTLLIITALMLVVGCSSDKEEPSSQTREPIDANKLGGKDVDGDGIYLWHAPDSDKPYSGVGVEYYDDGQKSGETTYKDGAIDGKWTEWYKSGEKKSEGTYIAGHHDNDGKRDGLSTNWHENGQKKSETTYKDGEIVGKSTGWYENGQKWYEETYKDGEKNGKWTMWYENGQKWTEETYKDGYPDWDKKIEWNTSGNVIDSYGNVIE